MKTLPVYLVLALAGVSLVTTSCGSDTKGNIFSKASKKNDKEKGLDAMLDSEWASAVDYLQSWLTDNPDDTEARQALGNAQMQLAGVDMLTMGMNAQTLQGSAKNDWQLLAKLMPAGTAENVAALINAVDALKSINPRTADQEYQLAVAQASLAVVKTKQVATDENGNYDNTKAASMSDEDATLIMTNARGANSSMASSGAGSGGANDKMSGVSSQMDAQPGNSDSAKLKNYLSTQ